MKIGLANPAASVSGIIGLLLLLSPIMPDQVRQQPADQLKLGYIENGDFGCGCSLSINKSDLRDRRYVFIYPMDGFAYINLNGNNLKLRMAAASPEIKREPKVGDRSWENWVAGNVKVRIDYTVTGVCAPDDEACEVTYYTSLLTIRSNGRKTVVKTVGLCGC